MALLKELCGKIEPEKYIILQALVKVFTRLSKELAKAEKLLLPILEK